jgi:hypothetical protein
MLFLNRDNCGIREPHPAAILGILRDIAFNFRFRSGFKSITEGISAMGENVQRLWKIITQLPQKNVYVPDG